MKTFWRTALLTTALGGAMVLGGALLPGGTARADDCYNRVRSEQWKLERDIQRHGYYSRQARHRRERILELRAGCRNERRHDRRWDGDRWRHRDRDDDWRRRDRDHDRDERWHRREHDRDHDRDER